MNRCAIAYPSNPVAAARAVEVEAELSDLFVQLTMERLPVASEAGAETSPASLLGKLDSGEADLAVAQASLLPASLPAGIRVAAVLKRKDPRYRAVGRGARSLDSLPPRSSIACPDAFARAQVLHLRPDLIALCPRMTPSALMEGVRTGEWSAALLGAETLERAVPWGLKVQPLDTGLLQPIAGSALTVLLARSGKSSRARQAGALDHAASRSLFDAERAFGAEGGFGAPLIATSFAHLDAGRIHVCSFASDEGGRRLHRSQAEGDLDAASVTGIAAARRLLEEVRATQFLLRASSL